MARQVTRRTFLGAVGASAGAALLSAYPVERASAGQDSDQRNSRAVPRIVRQWAAAWNAHDPERMVTLFTNDGVYEDLAFEARFQGKEGVALWVLITNASIGDAKIEIVDAFQRGNRAAAMWTFSGTDIGAIAPHLPPTGKSFSLPVVSFFELKSSLIRHVRDSYNLATLLRQLGLPADAYTPPGATPPA
ncbi:MAG: nuclear transport factor 2 family protein [Roseiflexaceae bacterium]|nr:nuclear transport factor 2 family protein [Roseiflexaceae bacterium]